MCNFIRRERSEEPGPLTFSSNFFYRRQLDGGGTVEWISQWRIAEGRVNEDCDSDHYIDEPHEEGCSAAADEDGEYEDGLAGDDVFIVDGKQGRVGACPPLLAVDPIATIAPRSRRLRADLLAPV